MIREFTPRYSEVLTDHFNNPRNVGIFNEAVNVGTGMAGTSEQGGVIRLQIQLDASGIIKDTRFKAYGNGAVIASSSWVSQELIGKSLDQALNIKAAQIVQALELAPVDTYCAILAQNVIEAAVNNYKQQE